MIEFDGLASLHNSQPRTIYSSRKVKRGQLLSAAFLTFW